MPVKSGVPQGSVLGPILFLIFIRDIDVAAGPGCLIKKFADDTKAAGRADEEAETDRLQGALDNIAGWADKWKMEFNLKKCKVPVMHFGPSNKKRQYRMGGQVLETTKVERHRSARLGRPQASSPVREGSQDSHNSPGANKQVLSLQGQKNLPGPLVEVCTLYGPT
jgi:hypothetical protein